MMFLFRSRVGLVALAAIVVGLLGQARPTSVAPAPAVPLDGLAPEPRPAGIPFPTSEPHPLDPLSEAEITLARKFVREAFHLDEQPFFPLIARHEPPKDEVNAWKPGNSYRREAFVVVFSRPAGRTFEAIVDLHAKRLRSLTEIHGVQPNAFVEEYFTGAELVRKDPRWQQAMQRRGLRNEQLAHVVIDTWVAGYVDRPELKGMRLMRAISYLRGPEQGERTNGNAYPRVIEGVIALVNMTKGEVVEVLDEKDDKNVVPIPAKEVDFFNHEYVGKLRDAPKPLEIVQPLGVNFALRGHEVTWQKWSLRHSFHPREGLVLHAVSYDDNGKVRPVLYRASLSEMVVPYGDPSAAWNWRNAFDVGEYGLGTSLTPVRRGSEVPHNSALLPAVIPDEFGIPKTVHGALAVYEQDAGMLWTHTDFRTGKTATRRGTQLVLHTLYTVGNYDYGVRWIFGQDGTIEVQVELTGVMLLKGVKDVKCPTCEQKPDEDGWLRPGAADRYGQFVARNIVATHHQHFFNFRLDFDIDGPKNSVHEMELVPEAPLPTNPERNAFLLTERLLRTEREAQRDLDHTHHRRWKVLNPNRTTALGHFPAFELVPGANGTPLAHTDSRIRKRARFADHPVWITRHNPREMYAAGDYPNQAAGEDGLPQYAADNQSLVGEDVVLWYTMGVSHAAKAEEWPVMPTTRAGFRLVPHNFFDRNPALDLP